MTLVHVECSPPITTLCLRYLRYLLTYAAIVVSILCSSACTQTSTGKSDYVRYENVLPVTVASPCQCDFRTSPPLVMRVGGWVGGWARGDKE